MPLQLALNLISLIAPVMAASLFLPAYCPTSPMAGHIASEPFGWRRVRIITG